jgi:hypothetical protein
MKLKREAHVEAAPVAPALPPGLLKLTVHLVGRICLVEHQGDYHALLLDAERNKSLGFRRHRPILRTLLNDATQAGADQSLVSFSDASGLAHVLWDINGQDMVFEGLFPVTPRPQADVAPVANLQAAFARVDGAATWRRAADLLGPAQPNGVLARLSLKGFERIDTMFFERGGILTAGDVLSPFPDDRRRVYLPGNHEQDTHAVVRCTARFLMSAAGKPALVQRAFASGDTRRIEFDDGAEPLLTVSNLCNCVGDPDALKVTLGAEKLVREDEEFALYYELLQEPPEKSQRPVPFLKEGGGALGVPECVPPGMISVNE